MEFATLQRPSYEDLERRRRMREGSPQGPRAGPGGKGLQRKDSVLTRGLNALRRRQSMVSNRKSEYEASFSTQPFTSLQTPDPEPPLSMMTSESTNARRQSYNFPNPPPGGRPGLTRSRSVLARARSFKHPEHFSQIPPMEITRLRSGFIFVQHLCDLICQYWHFGNLLFIHASTHATDDHKYS